jgi:single-strand DNA-binding protein
MNYNKVIIAGHLTRDPDQKFTASGKSLCNLSLAINEPYQKKDGTYDSQVVFIDVTAWGALAERAAKNLKKGSQAFVEGKLKLDQWQTPNGEKKQRIKISAFRILMQKEKGPKGNGGRQESEKERMQREIDESYQPF